MRDRNYIRWRKIKGLANSLCQMICYIFPINRDKITVSTFEGKGGFGCSPRYIVEELHRIRPEIKVVWLVNSLDHEMPRYVKKARNTPLSRAYHLATSKLWIDNYRKPYGTIKRKGQFYLNTWHGSIFIKPIGLWRGDTFSEIAYMVSKNDSNMIDALLVDSEWGKEAAKKGNLYNGDVWITGLPRQDILYGSREKEKKEYRRRHGFAEDIRILVYAPTFKERTKDGKRSVYSGKNAIDFNVLLRTLTDKFGGEWIVCARLHPQLQGSFSADIPIGLEKRIIDVTDEDDMYEILAAADAYVTDYSSTAFEAGFAEIPVFIFANDIEDYANDRGKLMWDMNLYPAEYLDGKSTNKKIKPGESTQLPFPIAVNNEMMEKIIRNFDLNLYHERMKAFRRAVGCRFDGDAAKRVVDRIEKSIGGLD